MAWLVRIAIVAVAFGCMLASPGQAQSSSLGSKSGSSSATTVSSESSSESGNGMNGILKDQQTRLKLLSDASSVKADAVSKTVKKIQDLEVAIAAKDHELLEQQHVLAQEQFLNAHFAARLQKEEAKLQSQQKSIMSDQEKVLQIQRLLSTLTNPAYARSFPDAAGGIVVNPAIVSKMELHETPFKETLRAGVFSLKGNLITDTVHPGPSILCYLYDDGTLGGLAQYEVAAPHGLPLPKVSKRAQATGRWRDVSVDWVELHGGSTYTFRGTYIPGSGKLTGTYDIMNTKEQGAFEYQIAEVHIMNPTKPGALPHDYLKLLPSLMDSHQYAEVEGALTAGFYIAEGKTVNSVTGKDTASPSLLLNLRDDGSLSGFAEFAVSQGKAHDTIPFRMGGVWNKEGFMYSFFVNERSFLFTGVVVPGTKDIVGGDYRFGRFGRGKGRFAFQMKRVVFDSVSQLDHEPYSSSLSSQSIDSAASSSALPSLSSNSVSGSSVDSDDDDDSDESSSGSSSGSTADELKKVFIKAVQSQSSGSSASVSSVDF